jgi:hypothetical protein
MRGGYSQYNSISWRHMRQKLLLAVTAVVGIVIAYVDTRPTWDDTGITVFAMLIAGGVIGLFINMHPWLFALALGIWLPLYYLLFKHNWTMLILLVIPLAGVYAGWGLRFLIRRRI